MWGQGQGMANGWSEEIRSNPFSLFRRLNFITGTTEFLNPWFSTGGLREGLSLRGHLSGGIFGCQNVGVWWCATGIQWAEAWDAGKHPTVAQDAPATGNEPAPKVSTVTGGGGDALLQRLLSTERQGKRWTANHAAGLVRPQNQALEPWAGPGPDEPLMSALSSQALLH